MKRIKKNVKIGHTNGIHIRVAQEIVKAGQNFVSEIYIVKISTPENPVNAKSILDLMTGGFEHGEEVELVCEGDDAEKAIEVMEYVVTSNFDKSGS
jgi:phosphotransferase system HPr (HPr) family protein